jgi:hypothetical protein
MPTDNGSRFDNDQGITPSRPKSVKQNPKSSIQYSQARARSFFLEHAQLLAKGDDLKAEVVTGTEEGAEKGEESLKKSKI